MDISLLIYSFFINFFLFYIDLTYYNYILLNQKLFILEKQKKIVTKYIIQSI